MPQTIELTDREAKLLKELLGLDLDSFGFDDEGDQDTFRSISEKIQEE